MYEKYLLQLEEAGKIRNLKERSINCYKNYVSYFKEDGKTLQGFDVEFLKALQDKLGLNKIAARWPAKAVAHFSFIKSK